MGCPGMALRSEPLGLSTLPMLLDLDKWFWSEFTLFIPS